MVGKEPAIFPRYLVREALACYAGGGLIERAVRRKTIEQASAPGTKLLINNLRLFFGQARRDDRP